MKRLALALVALVAFAAPPATAGHSADFSATGLIAVANPITRVIGGVTEQGSPCLGSIDPDVPPGTFQGVDGHWIDLQADPQTGVSPFAGHAATLTAAAPNDVDAWFYDAGCGLITPSADPNAYSMATLDPAPNGDESGTIPLAAAWAVVDLYAGAAATFTFTVPATS